MSLGAATMLLVNYRAILDQETQRPWSCCATALIKPWYSS